MADPTSADQQISRYWDDVHSGWAWAWRCWDSSTCGGAVGIDLTSEEAARAELARHIADEHKEATP